MRTTKFMASLAGLVVLALPGRGAEPTVKLPESPRIVFCGDSITGQGGGWMGVGYCFQMDWALKQAHPGSAPVLVALGGSGMGVMGWQAVEKKSQTAPVALDVKSLDVQTNLDQPADVLVVMLGMNDVLAPYIGGSDEDLDKWIGKYRELLAALRERMKPKVTALGTITMFTEDPSSYKNRQLARMNERIRALAKEVGAVALPSGEACWEVQAMGRRLAPDFHITRDYIHPNALGNQAVALGMLRGLGEEKAADVLMEQRIRPALAKAAGAPKISYEISAEPKPDTFRLKTWWAVPPGTTPSAQPVVRVTAPSGWTVTPAECRGVEGSFVVKGHPDRLQTVFKIDGSAGGETRQAEATLAAPWLVAGGLVQPWKGTPPAYDPAANRTAIDDAVEKGSDFTGALDAGRGKSLVWQRHYPSVNLTGGGDPGSVDYADVSNGETFEGGYAARWIHSDRARPVKIELTMKNLGARIFMTMWLNGRVIYQNDLSADPQRKETGKAIVDAELQAGENVLVIKTNHLTWQWLFSANLRGVGEDDLADLRYSLKPSGNPK